MDGTGITATCFSPKAEHVLRLFKHRPSRRVIINHTSPCCFPGHADSRRAPSTPCKHWWSSTAYWGKICVSPLSPAFPPFLQKGIQGRAPRCIPLQHSGHWAALWAAPPLAADILQPRCRRNLRSNPRAAAPNKTHAVHLWAHRENLT